MLLITLIASLFILIIPIIGLILKRYEFLIGVVLIAPLVLLILPPPLPLITSNSLPKNITFWSTEVQGQRLYFKDYDSITIPGQVTIPNHYTLIQWKYLLDKYEYCDVPLIIKNPKSIYKSVYKNPEPEILQGKINCEEDK